MSPDPTYNIIVLGSPSVGKTCFIDQALFSKSFALYSPSAPLPSYTVTIENCVYNLLLMDLSTAFLSLENALHDKTWATSMLANAHGVVLLYDITNLDSFTCVTEQAYAFLWACRRVMCEDDEEQEGFGCVLVGNKADLVSLNSERREVSRSLAEEWAGTQGLRSVEVDSLGRRGPDEALELLVRSIRKVEGMAKSHASGGKKQGNAVEGMKKKSMRRKLRDVFTSSRT